MSKPMGVETMTVDGGTSWRDIRGMSRRLLDHAQNNDWKSALEIQARRDGLIRGFFSSPVLASEVDSVREGILEVLELDKEVMELTRQERCGTGAKIYRIQFGRKAQKVYADTCNGI